MKKSETSFFEKFAKFIVDKKSIIIILYCVAMAFCFISQSWVKVCNELTDYLPKKTETKQGLTIMDENFITHATCKALVINITYDNAEKLSEKLEELPEVNMVTFDGSKDHYKDASALFDISLTCKKGSSEIVPSYNKIKDFLKNYDSYLYEANLEKSDILESEMPLIIVIVAIIIIAVLLLTSKSYMEVPVLLVTFLAGIILNKGTNYWFGTISFVSNSVTSILQLALSIDYAIILINHYTEQREFYDIRNSVIKSLAKSIPEIASSSLTTISGLAALMFMQFGIGFDMGICLIKAIIFSLLSVFTFMPGLLILFGKYIDKTKHRCLLPDISRIGYVLNKLKNIVPPLFAVIIIVGCILSNNCSYTFDSSSTKTITKNSSQIALEEIEKIFGTKNQSALVLPSGNYNKEKALIKELKKYKQVKNITALSSVEAKDEYVLTDALTPRQFSELMDIDINEAKILYASYAATNEDYGKLITNMAEYKVPIIDMFMYVHDIKEDGYIDFDADTAKDLDDLYDKLDSAKEQLTSEKYTRLLIELNLPLEGKETFDFLDTIHNVTDKYYDKYYLVGNSTSCYDLSSSFTNDNIIVSVLSILFVLIILFFTFKNAGLPALLILVIQGSIWINFSCSYIQGANMFFLSYLIVCAIQMGANIDYAIVITSRYMNLKEQYGPRGAIKDALGFAFPTIFTSGTILASAGLIIGCITTEPSISSLGLTLCRGTIISMILVLLVLPEILLLGDSIVEKTRVKIKKPDIVRKETGRFIVNGRVRGQINGFVDAEIHGFVRGDMDAIVSINTIKNEKEND